VRKQVPNTPFYRGGCEDAAVVIPGAQRLLVKEKAKPMATCCNYRVQSAEAAISGGYRQWLFAPTAICCNCMAQSVKDTANNHLQQSINKGNILRTRGEGISPA